MKVHVEMSPRERWIVLAAIVIATWLFTAFRAHANNNDIVNQGAPGAFGPWNVVLQ